MVLFTIWIKEVDNEKVSTGRELCKAYEWPLVPRVGDNVGVGGNQYAVHEVIHNFDYNPATIDVILHWPQFDFGNLSENPSWKRVFWPK